MTAPADNSSWRTAGPDAWVDDTTDVLHCSMPPQVRQHITELRAEVIALSTQPSRGYAVVADYGGPVVYGEADNNWDRPYPTVRAAAADIPDGTVDAVIVALVPVADQPRRDR